MRSYGIGPHPWDVFQARITVAICRATDEHQTATDLLGDLGVCETFLRGSTASIEDLDTPVAKELQSALVAHEAEDLFQYDEVCTANVVLPAMNAIANKQLEDGP